MRRFRFRALASGVVAMTLLFSGAPTATEPFGKGRSFVDEFDRLDKRRWYVSDGWVNGDHQNCLWSADQVRVNRGRLRLSFASRPSRERRYACAEVQSKERYGYGVYEARLKAVAGSGFNTGFFTYIGPVHKEPWHEIDFEILGKNTSKVQLNRFIDGKGGHEKMVALSGGADLGYHDYAFVWERERLRYFVDGTLVQTVSAPEKLPSRPMKIFVTLWASDTLTSWMGAFREPARPLAASVERVSFTALGEPCLYPESLVCRLN